MPRTDEERLASFEAYWKNPEKIRERNRRWYYEHRGLPVPEKKEYTLRDPQTKQKITKESFDCLKMLEEKLKKMKEELDEREKQLDEREKALKKVEGSYTLKAYQPSYNKEYREKKKEEKKVEIAPPPPPSFTISF